MQVRRVNEERLGRGNFPFGVDVLALVLFLLLGLRLLRRSHQMFFCVCKHILNAFQLLQLITYFPPYHTVFWPQFFSHISSPWKLLFFFFSVFLGIQRNFYHKELDISLHFLLVFHQISRWRRPSWFSHHGDCSRSSLVAYA